VLVASAGRPLAESGVVASLRRALLPLCRVVTPNLPELAILAAAREAEDEPEILRQSGCLLKAGAPAVLVKGGHASGDLCTDMLVRPDREPIRFAAPRLTGGIRGTGCMLASGIAAHLALGASLEESAQLAKQRVFDNIRRAS